MTSRSAAFSVCCALLVGSAVTAAPVSGQGTWETTLQARDLDGNSSNGPEAFYDTTLDVTWLAAGSATDGTWATMKAWAEQSRYGFTDWRLPTVVDTGVPGCDSSITGGTDCGYNVQTKSGNPTQYENDQTIYSALAHLWYVTLGNKALHAPGTGASYPPGWGLTNTGDFVNLIVWAYWTDTVFDPNVWQFHAGYGYQDPNQGKLNGLRALVLRSGDVLAIPEPKPVYIILLAIGMMSAMKRRSDEMPNGA